MKPDTWRDRAACRNHPPELWFAHPSQVAAVAEAQAICATCPVRAECKQAALDFETSDSGKYRYGIWGGTTPYDRAGKRNPPVRQKSAECGTDAGYFRHLKRKRDDEWKIGETPCEACKTAHREAERERAARRRAVEREVAIAAPSRDTGSRKKAPVQRLTGRGDDHDALGAVTA